ncbi:MAG: DUF1573 domain-containing protein [Tannerella sp.]|nr:DUF1573 domain-containing protein [Tannerella sp.]
MKRLVFVFMAILLTANLAVAQEEEEETGNKAVIAVTEQEHDFGRVPESGGKVSHTFTVKNTGTAPLVITRVIASCGCTTPTWTKEPIAPGKTGKVIVTYDPEGRPGTFTKSVSIFSNGKRGAYTLLIRGNVV